MSFNVMGACVVVLVHFSRSRRAEERMALKKRVKKEEEVKKEDKKVRVKKEDKKVKVKKEEEVKVKKEEEVKVKKEEEEADEETETDEVEKRENNDIKQNDSAIKHCDSFFTMLLEGSHLPSPAIVESENLVRRRHGY